MTKAGDAIYTSSPGERHDGGDRAATQAGPADARVTKAPPAEPMTRSQYADYMMSRPAAGADDDATRDNAGAEDDTADYASTPDSDSPWTDPAVQAQGMTRSEYAGYMTGGPAAGADDDATIEPTARKAAS